MLLRGLRERYREIIVRSSFWRSNTNGAFTKKMARLEEDCKNFSASHVVVFSNTVFFAPIHQCSTRSMTRRKSSTDGQPRRLIGTQRAEKEKISSKREEIVLGSSPSPA